MKRSKFLKLLTVATCFMVACVPPLVGAESTEPIKVGILHSLSGTMAISETSLKDVALMTIEEINKSGGVMGRQLEPVVVDPASNWPLFAEKARQLLSQDKVAVVFGCWTSVSRKSVLPVFEELNGLLFYPVQYEGEEMQKNVFYTGAAPNQQAIPAVEYLMSKEGGGAKRFFPAGNRLRLSPNDQQNSTRLPSFKRGGGYRYQRNLYPFRTRRLSDDRRRYQKILAGRKDRGDLDDQWRFERSFL